MEKVVKFYLFQKDFLWHLHIKDVQTDQILSEHTFDRIIKAEEIIDLVKLLTKASNLEVHVDFTKRIPKGD